MILEKEHHSVTDRCLVCIQRECNSNGTTVDEHRTKFESRISAGATEKITWVVTQNSSAIIRYGRPCEKETGKML